jgi:hypothetical protein
MTEFVVKMIVEGRNTQTTVSANDSSAAAAIARAQYSGSSVRVIETTKVRK